MFLDLNGAIWEPDPPALDDAVEAMLTIAAREHDEQRLATWIRARVRSLHDTR